MKIDKLKLTMGRPFLVDEKTQTYVHHPIMKDIVDLGEDEYLNLCLPYILTKDAIFGNLENSKSLSEKYELLQLFFIKVNEDQRLLDGMFNGNTMDYLKNSLSFFLKTDDIRILERQQKIVINKEYLIDNSEFMRLRKVIQSVSDRSDIKVEKPPENMTERQRDIWTKLQKGRKRKSDKERVYIQDMINVVSFGGNSYISKDLIENMHYIELSNAYKAISQKDIYHTRLLHRISPKFESDDKFEHWFENLKIGN